MTQRYLSQITSSQVSVPMKVTKEPKIFPSKQVVILIVVAVIGVISALTLLYFCLKRAFFRRSNGRFSSKEIGKIKIELRKFSLDEIGKATLSFSKECLVGSGGFGNVYKGVFDEGRVFAIKRAHADSYESIHEFRNEVELLSRVKHQNLVGLVGYCQVGDQRILVYEYVPHGSLLEYIVGRKREPLTWRQRVNIAIGAAKGIAHLHEGVNPSIIHRDIKPSNILVGEGFEAKVSDFGLVKTGPVGDESHVSSLIKGTPGYLDPAYCSSYHLTPFSDVYSFGIILLQLISARPAVHNSKPDAQIHIIDWARPSLERGVVQEILDANLLLEPCNMEMMLKMGQIGLRCVAKKYKNRPTMSQVVQELEAALNNTTSYMNKKPSGGIQTLEESMSFSIDGVGLMRFHLDTDDVSVQSASMRCFDVSTISIDVMS